MLQHSEGCQYATICIEGCQYATICIEGCQYATVYGRLSVCCSLLTAVSMLLYIEDCRGLHTSLQSLLCRLHLPASCALIDLCVALIQRLKVDTKTPGPPLTAGTLSVNMHEGF